VHGDLKVATIDLHQQVVIIDTLAVEGVVGGRAVGCAAMTPFMGAYNESSEKP
jgi:hypothetical protein